MTNTRCKLSTKLKTNGLDMCICQFRSRIHTKCKNQIIWFSESYILTIWWLRYKILFSTKTDDFSSVLFLCKKQLNGEIVNIHHNIKKSFSSNSIQITGVYFTLFRIYQISTTLLPINITWKLINYFTSECRSNKKST